MAGPFNTGAVSTADQNFMGSKTLDNNGNGLAMTQGGKVNSIAAAGTALTGSSTETALASYTIPANSLRAGDVLRVRWQGIATATNSTDTLTVKLYVGGLSGTAIITGAATDAADNDTFNGEALVVVRTIGASGTFVAHGRYQDVGVGTSVGYKSQTTASTALDTTATIAISLSGKWSTTSGSNSCRADIFIVEVI